MKNFFISYTGVDRAWGEWIAWHLEEAGYTTTLQAWDFRPGSNFVLQMHAAAQDSERTIAVLSERYMAAAYTHPEWAAAFRQDPTGAKRRLVPVRVGACEPQGLLGATVYIDLVGLSPDAARRTLLAGLAEGRAKPSVAPEFPGASVRSVTAQPLFPPLATLFPDASPERIAALERAAGIPRDEKVFLGGMWEIAALDSARLAVLEQITALDRESAALAEQLDAVHRTLAQPGQPQQYEKLRARADELRQKRAGLDRTLREMSAKRERKMAAQREWRAARSRELDDIFKFPGPG
jgi:hypothetical protein